MTELRVVLDRSADPGGTFNVWTHEPHPTFTPRPGLHSNGSKCAVKCLRNFGSFVIFDPRIPSIVRVGQMALRSDSVPRWIGSTL